MPQNYSTTKVANNTVFSPWFLYPIKVTKFQITQGNRNPPCFRYQNSNKAKVLSLGPTKSCDRAQVPKPPAASAIWVFPKIGVPQNGWFIMENPIKMDDFGGITIFGKTHMFFSNPNTQWDWYIYPLEVQPIISEMGWF